MSEIKVKCQEDFEILREIEEKIIKKVDLGFDSMSCRSSTARMSSRSQIETLKAQLSAGVVTRLFGLANSVHYGRLRAGKMTDFSDVILRLGLGPSKIYILSLALFFLNFRRDFTELAARSFIISFLGKMLASKMGLAQDEIREVEIGGIFLKVGRSSCFSTSIKRVENWRIPLFPNTTLFWACARWRSSSFRSF